MICVSSQFQFVALAIDIMHGRGSSKEMCLQLQPDKAKVMLCIIRRQKVLYTLFITNKMDHFSFKSEHVIHEANSLKRLVRIVMKQLCTAVKKFISEV